MVGVTSIEKTYVVGFAFLKCEKEDNFMWAVKVSRSLLREQVEMPKAIVTDRNTVLVNVVAKLKEKVVFAWTGDFCRDWDSVNLMIKNQHNEIQTIFGRSITVLEHRFKDNILYSQLIDNVSRTGLNYIFHEAKRGEVVGSDNAKCGCTISKTYGLPCACVIAKKIKPGEKSNISITSELEAIQERFSKAGDNIKLHIKEQLRKIGYPKTTDMKPSSQLVKTKGAPKKLKPTSNDNSTTRAHSYCEHVDKLFPDSPTPKSQTSSNKEVFISKPPPTPIPPKIPIIEEMPIPAKITFIKEMQVFMHKYIERIVNVAGDGNCGYRTVSTLLGNGENSHTLVHHQLIQ
ncbi:uncharacterized protein LOC131620051 [Vicia villosa]|uniref:uncharacterized protein LOC131620051 n=1 Tax=Vicia villosa TaxID=3911 RepID=UPI00273B1550|nr:uncharacterized protein LOC131620051 [Vicia villosa]